MEDEAILRDELRSVCRNAGRYLTGLYLKKKKKITVQKYHIQGFMAVKRKQICRWHYIRKVEKNFLVFPMDRLYDWRWVGNLRNRSWPILTWKGKREKGIYALHLSPWTCFKSTASKRPTRSYSLLPSEGMQFWGWKRSHIIHLKNHAIWK